ncbi:ATP-dependent DNA helicase [Agrobacterium tumefaciens]|uniref:ATP-dependent helicase n=1 Tax=Rhizobium/Agrobacterium group TaxID=227290 RepID=UPI0010CC3403|nr:MULTISPECIES: UvrD-helicase domain-containing protein [Rhizobium/Agrobacterium group]MCZ7499270.1 UvrD-helicase domain-containing protein [Rhizobium rhizogenes]MDA5242474.1 UvrD-helicase domain-containing protein [Agrobacterium sp. MAFF310724]MDA5248146.1 UvrD-helicase domain-containing protein [Agrobacterium sp. MAFF210268]TKV77116.1 ATP-dependent DNA helicase [Rhizobium sp. AU243]TRB15880.1 ATP-dependent DNA helicase [Agrobacterium tumefaciens]
MSNSFDDMPFFDEEPAAPRRATNNAGAESGGGLGIAARAMAARDQTRAAPDYLSGLNPEQREAVETLDGPVLVLAGAGTGKTRVLTTRIAHILATGRAYPSQILAVTFTNKAAREMKERIGVLVGGAVEGMPWLGTFHSIGVKLLRRHAELVGLKSDFTILDTDDVVRLIKQLIQAEGLDDKRWPAKQFAGMIDGWKNKGLTPPDIPEGDSRAFANGKGRELYSAYQNRLKTLNACDFGDLLMHPISIFRRHTDILKEYHQKFRYILVDEYQDTNTAQYMWLRLLAQRAKGEPQNVCCVGDDDQSIYGWRGAEVDNILRFDKDFPGAKVIKLERNYRSTEHILGAAGHLIAHNEGRLGKTLFTERSSPDDEKVVVHAAWDSEEEARAVGEEIEQLQRKNHNLNDMAILVRASFQMREFEDRFVTLGLNYRVIGGPRFYERLEIRDAMAYFRLVCQPADDLAFERIVNTPKRGLGDTTIRNLHDYARARDIPMLAAAADIIETDELKPKARKALFDVVQDFRRWQGLLENTEHTTLAEQILDESGYTAMWQADKTAEAPGRLENLKELIRSMEAFESMRGFLEHVALVMDAEQNENLDAVSIMTLHSAKGLEFDTVFLPGWEEGLFPHQRALDEGGRSGLEEERRLAYVGITRAKKLCHIWFVSNRRIHGLWQSTLPSRFLDELPPAHVDVAASDSSYGGYGGRGGYGQSRFDKADPFTNNYSTPGWKRAQQNRSDATRDNWGTRSGHAVERIGYGESGPRTRTIDGELVAKSVADTPSKFFVGDRVFHLKFGNGNISAIEGNKLTIDFDRAGQKRVLDGFVEKV